MHVDLTKKSQYSETMPSSMSDGHGLHLYIDDLAVLDLPDEGCITFKYKKGPVTATEASEDRPARASATLRLLEICDAESEDLEEEKDETDSDKSIDELFEEAGSESPVDEVE